MNIKYGTIIGNKVFSIYDGVVKISDVKYFLINEVKINDIFVSDSPFEINKDKIKKQQLGDIQIKSGNIIIQENRIINNKLTLKKKC